MSIESLQRAAEAAGFATASDDNPDTPVRSAQPANPLSASYPASLLAKPRSVLAPVAATIAAPGALWGRAGFGQFIPSWAARG